MAEGKRVPRNAAGRKPNRVRFYRRDDAHSDPMDELEWEDRQLVPGMKVWVWYEDVRGATRRVAHVTEVEDDAVRVRYGGQGRPVGFDECVVEERLARFGKDGWSLELHVQMHEQQPVAIELELLKRKFPDRH